VTDEDRRNMWLPIHKTARTTTAMISSVPEAIVKMPSPAVLEIEFRGAGAKNKAKPEGMHGCEIRGVISESPVTEWGQLADSYFDTHSPLKINFTGEDRGKRFYFALRWENNRGEKGEWSEIYFAIIP
jgi:hypothetical protein